MGNVSSETKFRIGYAPHYQEQNDYAFRMVLDDAVQSGVVAGSPFSGRIFLDVKADAIEITGPLMIKVTGRHSHYSPAIRGDSRGARSFPEIFQENTFLESLSEIPLGQRNFVRGTYAIPFSTAIPYGSAVTYKSTIPLSSSATRYFLEVFTMANSSTKLNVGGSGVLEFPVTTQMFSLIADPLQFGPSYCNVPPKKTFLSCTAPPVENILFGVYVPGIITQGIPFPVSFIVVNYSRFLVQKLEITIKGKDSNSLVSTVLTHEQLVGMGINPLPFSGTSSAVNQTNRTTSLNNSLPPEASAQILNELRGMRYAVQFTIPLTTVMTTGLYVLSVRVGTNGPTIENRQNYMPQFVGIQTPPVFMQLPPEGIAPKNIRDAHYGMNTARVVTSAIQQYQVVHK